MKSKGLIILFFSFVSAFGQEEQPKIKWHENRQLSWEDFKAEPDNSIAYSANTNSGIGYSWNYSTASGIPEFQHEVYTNFYPNLSWVKDIQNEEYLLAHEQLHFDISELHARKLRKILESYEIGRNIRQDLKRLYNVVESDRVAMQNRFDKETAHSENKTAELKWRHFVAEELFKLQDYAL
ncbi:DUF922 domain-containing protein [Christiangramia sp. SM2212]|uniref:DUF922 domain-containing protein n=1 Tax=Christiangramia sediminicola TaxID=3073267 RepID=A0ABU1ERU9_9FLAO|nr:DUF922 domain-containing protein [Christiangramia sp. SM2212]MDR5590762.1 DUF922 domain-containing protein [Christiangramia sp. SM2212]